MIVRMPDLPKRSTLAAEPARTGTLRYDANVELVAHRYESLDPDALHAWLKASLPALPAGILDIGAGTGRDAAWFAARGFDVAAAEPSAAMRAHAQRTHPEPKIQWTNDSLPAMRALSRSGLSFDMILLNVVWMHVLPRERPRAFRKLINLLRPGGLLAFT